MFIVRFMYFLILVVLYNWEYIFIIVYFFWVVYCWLLLLIFDGYQVILNIYQCRYCIDKCKFFIYYYIFIEFNVVCKEEVIFLMCVECLGVYLKSKKVNKLFQYFECIIDFVEIFLYLFFVILVVLVLNMFGFEMVVYRL